MSDRIADWMKEEEQKRANPRPTNPILRGYCGTCMCMTEHDASGKCVVAGCAERARVRSESLDRDLAEILRTPRPRLPEEE